LANITGYRSKFNTNDDLAAHRHCIHRRDLICGLCTHVGVTSKFSRIRFNIDPNNDHTGLRNWGSANSVQVAELTLYNGGTKLTSGVATNPGGNTPAAEGAGKLIDGNTGTKWYVGILIDSVGLNGLSCSTLLFGLRLCTYGRLDFNKKSVVITFPQLVHVTSYSVRSLQH